MNKAYLKKLFKDAPSTGITIFLGIPAFIMFVVQVRELSAVEFIALLAAYFLSQWFFVVSLLTYYDRRITLLKKASRSIYIGERNDKD